MTTNKQSAPLIVLVEDEDHLAHGLIFNLEAEGYRTHHESNGDSALTWLLANPSLPAAVILDGMLPGLDGFEVVKALRDKQIFLPVLMLTARSRPEDIVAGFEAGADDYLPKPFELNILIARLKSLLRRIHWNAPEAPTDATPTQPAEYAFNNRTIRFDTLELHALGKVARLTLMEADLIRYFTDRPGKIISRKEILEQVWQVHEDTDTRAIDNFIVRLRRYLEDNPAKPAHLISVRGVGYRFLPDGKPSTP